MSDTSIVDKKAKKAEYEKQLKLRKAEARKKVLQFVKDNEKDLGALASDIRLLAGGGSGQPRVPGVTRSINADLRAAFLEAYKAGKSISEMDVFMTFHIGRPEMVNKARALVLCPNPADRVWIKFDEVAEVYNVVGLGAEPPTGFDGYIPEAKVL